MSSPFMKKCIHTMNQMWEFHSEIVEGKHRILFPKLFWLSVRKKHSIDCKKNLNFKVKDQEFAKKNEITRPIYLNSERSVQFLKQNAFWNCSWRFSRSNTSEQLEFKSEKIIWIYKSAGKVRKTILCQKLFLGHPCTCYVIKFCNFHWKQGPVRLDRK